MSKQLRIEFQSAFSLRVQTKFKGRWQKVSTVFESLPRPNPSHFMAYVR